jgi:hypothetical protein
MTTHNKNLFENIVTRNRRGYIRDLVAGVMLAVGLVSGATALALAPLPSTEVMDTMLKANPMPSGDLAVWACAAGDETACEPA